MPNQSDSGGSQPPPPPRKPRRSQPSASDDVLSRNEGLVRHIVGKRLTRSHPAYEDALQEGRLALLRAEQTFDTDIAKWSTYAGRCISNAVTSLLRNQPDHEPLDVIPREREGYVPDYLQDEDEDPRKAKERERVRTLVNQLPATERKVIECRFGLRDDRDDEMSQRETATFLRMSRSGVAKAEARALRKLRAAYPR